MLGLDDFKDAMEISRSSLSKVALLVSLGWDTKKYVTFGVQAITPRWRHATRIVSVDEQF